MIRINEEVINIVKRIVCNGKEAYIIGGAVRDYILGVEPYDYDIATSLLPDEVISLFSDYKNNSKSKKYGTITLFINSLSVEITTFREEDNYLNKRSPKEVYFVESLLQDVKRRDFTINALALDIRTYSIIDYYNGMDDLNNKILRTIGDTKVRFKEDCLRILRALRFISKYNLICTKEIEESLFLKELYQPLLSLPKEVVGKEIQRIIEGDNFSYVIKKYSHILTMFLDIYKYKEKYINYLDKTNNNMILKLAIMYYDNPELLEELYKINISIKKVNLLRKWINGAKTIDFTQKTAIKWAIYTNNYDFCVFCMNIYILINDLDNEEIVELKARVNELKNCCYSLEQLLLSEDDLRAFGVVEKKRIERIRKDILKKVVKSELNNDHDELLTYIHEML